jgi:hypothetical protein
MKEKKLKKIVQLVVEEVRIREYDNPIKKSMYTGDWAEKDEDVSDKLKTMLLNLLNYRNNINININDSSLSISTDNLSGIKKVRTSSSGLTKVSDDDYFSVEIIKGTGFTINKGYNVRTQYLDNKMFDEILPLATNKLKEINSENFNDIWNVVMKESGLMRDNNIDELLKNINE